MMLIGIVTPSGFVGFGSSGGASCESEEEEDPDAEADAAPSTVPVGAVCA
jgi:hypothetical protein